MKSVKRFLFMVVLFMIFDDYGLFAQGSTARFLYYRPNAVSSSMGGMGAAYFRDAYASYFNPAGLAFSPSFSIGGSFDKPLPMFPGEVYSFMGLSFRISDRIVVGGSTNLYWKGNQAKTLSNSPDIVSLDAPFDWEAKLSVGYLAGQHLGVGVSAAFLRTIIAGFGTEQAVRKGISSTVLFDFGILASSLSPEATFTSPGLETGLLSWSWIAERSQKGLSIGASVLNVGPKLSFIDRNLSDHPPSTVLVGATYYPLQSEIVGLMIGLDGEKRLFESEVLSYFHYGSELTLLRLLALRAGYSQGTGGGENSFFSMGAGIRVKCISLNFARYTQTILPTWQFDASFFTEL